MSSLDSVISRMCKQIAVYWGSPKNDGQGYYTFALPVEIQCRWQDGVETIKDSNGREIVSRATIFVLQDLDEEGYLWLGRLSDLTILKGTPLTTETGIGLTTESGVIMTTEYDTEDPTTHPHNIDGSYIIKKFLKMPSIKADTFVRKCYIG